MGSVQFEFEPIVQSPNEFEIRLSPFTVPVDIHFLIRDGLSFRSLISQIDLYAQAVLHRVAFGKALG